MYDTKQVLTEKNVSKIWIRIRLWYFIQKFFSKMLCFRKVHFASDLQSLLTNGNSFRTAKVTCHLLHKNCTLCPLIYKSTLPLLRLTSPVMQFKKAFYITHVFLISVVRIRKYCFVQCSSSVFSPIYVKYSLH